MARRLTKKGFREWLATFHPDQIVGRVGASRDCPIARYGRSLGWPRPSVGLNKYRTDLDDPATATNTPKWAEEFIGRVDDDDRKRATAKRALQILDEV